MDGHQVAGAEILELAIEREKIATLAHRPHHVDTRSASNRLQRLDTVKGVVV